MSKRMQTAISVLTEGGYFRYALERNYLGYEQFATRLISSTGETIKGVGFKLLLALKSANIVERDFSENYGSTAQEIYRLVK